MLFSRLAVVSLALLAAWVAHAAISRPPCKLYVAPATRVDQGCLDQGNDRRLGAPVVCWLQRHLSWKSQREPRVLAWGDPRSRFVAVAWPPYLVFDSADGYGHWRMFRAGFRYDHKWSGYIFPTAAYKCLAKPLLY